LLNLLSCDFEWFARITLYGIEVGLFYNIVNAAASKEAFKVLSRMFHICCLWQSASPLWFFTYTGTSGEDRNCL